MTRFWLIRHGAPAEEVRQRCYGSLDVGLSEQGRGQMTCASEYLRGEPLAAIYSSPQRRALESAEILASVALCPVNVVPELREIDFGAFEGLTYEEIAARYPETYRRWMEQPAEVEFPGGESFSTMRARVLGAFEGIRTKSEGQTVAIVSHGGVNRILIAWALEIPAKGLFRLAQDYAGLNLLTVIEGFLQVKLMNGDVTRRVLGRLWT